MILDRCRLVVVGLVHVAAVVVAVVVGPDLLVGRNVLASHVAVSAADLCAVVVLRTDSGIAIVLLGVAVVLRRGATVVVAVVMAAVVVAAAERRVAVLLLDGAAVVAAAVIGAAVLDLRSGCNGTVAALARRSGHSGGRS